MARETGKKVHCYVLEVITKDGHLASFRERLPLRKVTQLSPVSEPTLKSRVGSGADHEKSRAYKIFGSLALEAAQPAAGLRSPNKRASKQKSGSVSLKIDNKIVEY